MANFEGRLAWPRGRFYVEDGFLKPVKGSAVEYYNPSDHYHGAGSDPGERSMYLDLASLDPSDSEAVERFARRWGRLGLYEDTVLQVRFQTEEDTDESIIARPIAALDLYAGLVRRLGSHAVEGFATTFQQVSRQVTDGYFREVPFRQAMGRFFPDVDWEHPPRPADERLLIHDYLCEPLNELTVAVFQFRRTFAEAAAWSEGQPDPDTLQILEGAFRSHLQGAVLHPVLPEQQHSSEPVSTKPTAPRWDLGFAFPSLLAAAHYQMFRDLQAGRFLRFCMNDTCTHPPFVTDRINSRFCSKTCQNTAKVRDYRRRQARQQQAD